MPKVNSCWFSLSNSTSLQYSPTLVKDVCILIKACSVPHLIYPGYYGDDYPSKTRYIESLIRKIPGKVAIGCTTLAAFDLYESYIRERFPDRPIYVVKGDVAFKRQSMVAGVRLHHQRHTDMRTAELEQFGEYPNLQWCDTGVAAMEYTQDGAVLLSLHTPRLQGDEGCHIIMPTRTPLSRTWWHWYLQKSVSTSSIKTGEVKEQSEIFEEFDITMSVIDSLLIRSTDSEGKIHISWGSQRVTS